MLVDPYSTVKMTTFPGLCYSVQPAFYLLPLTDISALPKL